MTKADILRKSSAQSTACSTALHPRLNLSTEAAASSSTVASSLPLDDAPRPDESASTLAPVAPAPPASHTIAYAPTSPTSIIDVDFDAPSVTDSRQRSRRPDRHTFLENVAYLCTRAGQSLTGLIRTPPLPSFPHCWQQAMASAKQYQVPQTPRVISPSPTPSETSAKDGYFGPVTRSAAKKIKHMSSTPRIDEDSSGSDPEKRARTRSRSPLVESRRRRMSGLKPKHVGPGKKGELVLPNGTVNGHLSPAAANKDYWREMSRSPSPLGLIPIHQKWRSFVSDSIRSRNTC